MLCLGCRGLWLADCCMPHRVRMFLDGLARQSGDAISIVATTEGGDAHVADAHRAARARHKRAPMCRYLALGEVGDTAHTRCYVRSTLDPSPSMT